MSMELKRSKQDLVDEENRQKQQAMIDRTNYKSFSRKYSNTIQSRVSKAEERRWEKTATQEALEMHSVLHALECETKRKHIRALHERERVSTLGALYRGTTLAGTWQKGAYLGPGPMPAKHPVMNPVDRWRNLNCEWDIHGRKHPLDASQLDTLDPKKMATVDQILRRMRDVFRRKSLHGLDLRRAFHEFDVDQSGSLTREEFVLALEALGIQRGQADVDEVMQFFDPNGNGLVNYGEFMWAFFNRRSSMQVKQPPLTRPKSAAKAPPSPKKQQKVKSLRQIKNLFFELDRTGRGVLSTREFKSVFMRLEMTENMTAVQIDRLVQRFDKDGDGLINYNEFVHFIRSEERARTVSAEQRRSRSQKSASHRKTDPVPQHTQAQRHSLGVDTQLMSAEIDRTLKKQENIKSLIRQSLNLK
jgi:Ca2+-binding EF-hand superfamily protein